MLNKRLPASGAEFVYAQETLVVIEVKMLVATEAEKLSLIKTKTLQRTSL